MTGQQSRHLDLGCGDKPRNPYGCDRLYGVDIRAIEAQDNVCFKQADLAFDPIPFADHYFSSVSAFDYLEHVPRVLMKQGEAAQLRYPFIELMAEIWRVLQPQGRFYALTPAFPHAAAFQDPTHVNVITEQTHEYFCAESSLHDSLFGFMGQFRVIRAEWAIHSYALNPYKKMTLARQWRRWRLKQQGRLSHFLWELEAVK